MHATACGSGFILCTSHVIDIIDILILVNTNTIPVHGTKLIVLESLLYTWHSIYSVRSLMQD